MTYTAKQKNTVYNKPESNPIKLHYCFTGLYIYVCEMYGGYGSLLQSPIPGKTVAERLTKKKK